MSWLHIWTNIAMFIVGFYRILAEILRNLFQTKWTFSTDKWLFRAIFSLAQYALDFVNNTKQQHKNIYDCCNFVIEVLLSENINYWHCIWDNKLKLNSVQKSIFSFELHEVADTLIAAPATVELMQHTIWKHFTAFEHLFSFQSWAKKSRRGMA